MRGVSALIVCAALLTAASTRADSETTKSSDGAPAAPRAAAAGVAQARATAPTASPGRLNLEDVLAEAERTYPLIMAAEKDREGAAGDLQAAQGGFDPLVRARGGWTPVGNYNYGYFDTTVTQPTPLWGTSVFAGYRYGGGKIPIYDGKIETLSLGELRAGLSVPLLRDGPIDGRRAALWSARMGPAIAEAGVAAQKLEVMRVSALRYWTWVETGHALLVARRALQLAQDRDAGLAERVQRGDLAQIERQDNQRAILARRAQVLAAERSYQGAAIELSLFHRDAAGRPVLAPLEQVPDFPEPRPASVRGVEDELRSALARRPELTRLESQKRQAELEVRLANNQLTPAVDVSAALSRDIGSGPSSLRPTALEVGVVVDVPVLGRVARGKAQSAQAKVDKLEVQQSFARDRIVAEVKDALLAEATAREQLALARSELDLAEQLAEAERDNLKLGSGTVLVLNLREQAAVDAAVRVIKATADHHRAMAVYRAAIAAPSTAPSTPSTAAPSTAPAAAAGST